jgi:cytochrome c553
MLRYFWLFLLIIFPGSVFANSNGELSAMKHCAACHGPLGISARPDSPNLAGLAPKYIIKQLKLYRDGHRKHELMNVVAENLDDDRIRELANWYDSLEVEVTYWNPTKNEQVAQTCSACHGLTGISKNPDAPTLAGQPQFYLADRLKAMRTNSQHVDIGMVAIANTLNVEETEQAVDWYSSIKIQAYRP